MASLLISMVVVGFWSALALAGFTFWIWMLIDCLKKDFKDSNERIIWVVVIVLCNLVGAIIYFFVGRKK